VSRKTYHHGDLRRALIEATVSLIESEGAAGFSLRKVAKAAGVSPSAPSHHFGDARGLLTAIAAEGFEAMVIAMEGISGDLEPHERLVEHGRAYVDLAIRKPGHMAVMFRGDLVDQSDASYVAFAPRSFELISAAVSDVIGPTTPDKLELATKTVWATCQGIATLYPTAHRSLADDPDLDHFVTSAVSIMSDGIRSST